MEHYQWDSTASRKYFREVLQADWSLKKVPGPRKDQVLPEVLGSGLTVLFWWRLLFALR